MSNKYILDGHTPVVCNDLMQWATWFEKADRVVAKTKIGDANISTVFLGLDHSFVAGKPLLFETMVFGGPHDEEMERYSTWEEAETGHKQMVNLIESEV